MKILETVLLGGSWDSFHDALSVAVNNLSAKYPDAEIDIKFTSAYDSDNGAVIHAALLVVKK